MKRLIISSAIPVALMFSMSANASWSTTFASDTQCRSAGASPSSVLSSALSKVPGAFPTRAIKVIIDTVSTQSASTNGSCGWDDTRTYSARVNYKWIYPENLNPSDSVFSGDQVLYNHTYTNEQCQAQFGGTNSYFVTGESNGHPVSNQGVCMLAMIEGSQSVCIEAGDMTSCSGDWIAVSTGNPMDDLESTGTISTMPFPNEYMTPVEECTTGSCITIDGQVYEVDQNAIDQGTVSIIGGTTGGGGDDGNGDTGGGDDGGGDGGSGGNGDGSGGSGGDGSGGGSGGSGGSGGDGSGGDGGGDGSSPWGGEGGYDGFGGEADHTARLDDAKDRYALAVADIQSEVSSLFSINAGGGGGGCTSSGSSASAFGVTIDMDYCRFIGPALPVIKPAVLFVAAAFALFILLGSATGRRS